jgi:hypothetical protein
MRSRPTIILIQYPITFSLTEDSSECLNEIFRLSCLWFHYAIHATAVKSTYARTEYGDRRPCDIKYTWSPQWVGFNYFSPLSSQNCHIFLVRSAYDDQNSIPFP